LKGEKRNKCSRFVLYFLKLRVRTRSIVLIGTLVLFDFDAEFQFLGESNDFIDWFSLVARTNCGWGSRPLFPGFGIQSVIAFCTLPPCPCVDAHSRWLLPLSDCLVIGEIPMTGRRALLKFN